MSFDTDIKGLTKRQETQLRRGGMRLLLVFPLVVGFVLIVVLRAIGIPRGADDRQLLTGSIVLFFLTLAVLSPLQRRAGRLAPATGCG